MINDKIRLGDWVSVDAGGTPDQYRGRVVGMYADQGNDRLILDVRLIGITIEARPSDCRKLSDEERIIAIAKQALRIYPKQEN